MKRHLSLFLLTLFFSAFCASAAVCAKGQVYEVLETEEVFSFELEEEGESERESGLEGLSDKKETNFWGGDGQPAFSSCYFNALFSDALPQYLAGLYQKRSVALHRHAQSAHDAFWRPPYFILYCAFQADC